MIYLYKSCLWRSTRQKKGTVNAIFSRLIHLSQSKYRRISNVILTSEEMKNGCRCGIDTHADTCVVGKHAHIISQVHGKSVQAEPFSPSLGALSDLPIVHAAVAYDDLINGTTTILEANHSIYVSDMEHCLLCPDQVREAGIRVDLTPTKYDPDSPFFLQWPDGFTIPLQSFGPIPMFRIRRPTAEELVTCERRLLTPECEWIPYPEEDQDPIPYSVYQMSVASTNIEEAPFHPIDQYLFQGNARNAAICSMNARRKRAVAPERVAALFGCGLNTAERTLQVTTQDHIRENAGNITRRYRTRRSQLRYRQLGNPYGQFYVDVHAAKVKSIRGYTCGAVFCNKLNYIYWHGLKTEKHTDEALQCFVQDVGVPTGLHSDNAKSLTAGKFRNVAVRENIKQTTIEVGRHNENRAELMIREIKKRVKRIMQRRNIPLRMWCFVMEYVANIMCLTASDLIKLKGRTPYEHVHGHTPDISEYLEFEMYEPVWYFDDENVGYPEPEKKLGRWLGVSHKVGQGMCYYILKSNGEVISRTTVSQVEVDDMDKSSFNDQLKEYDRLIHERYGDYKSFVIHKEDQDVEVDDEYLWLLNLDAEDEEVRRDSDDAMDDLDNQFPSKDIDEIDTLIGVNVIIPHNDEQVQARVIDRVRDDNGNQVGKFHINPVLNTGVYNVQLPDGSLAELSANVIAENIYKSVDDHGFNYTTMKDILEHRKDETAVEKEDGWFITSSGQRRRVITTKGWSFRVRWEDQSTSWTTLADLKASYPYELAEYAVANGISDEPAFAWWVNTVISKQRHFISKVKSRIRKKRMKFGILIPQTVEEAYEIDRVNGNDYWRKAIEKEMKNNKIAFQFLGPDGIPPPGYQKITCHMVFDVKFDLTRKARYVAGGHLTEVPASQTYSSVVSRDSVRILFTIAALNNLDIRMCDIGNAYLNAETREKVYFTAGPEWGAKQGESVLIVRALYGLKTSGAEWKKHFADTLRYVLGFKPSLADDNVWLKECTKEDGSKYYTYILVYVDDVLCVGENPDYYMNILNEEYRLKSPPVEPMMYLGADISQFEIRDELGNPVRKAWRIGAESHIKKAVQVVKGVLEKGEQKYKFKRSKKVPQNVYTTQAYRPDLDCTEYCDDDQWQLYNSLIGIARWICELGRIDILTETSELSSYLAAPRQGHLEQALHIFHYLEHHQRSGIVLDPAYYQLDLSGEDPADSTERRAEVMKELYPDAEEDIPPDAPKPLGKSVQVNLFVDANHAGDTITRRSRTGIIIFLNMAPIIWVSQRQATVESSTFGSEFVAMRNAIEHVKSLRYKLRMFGIPIEGPAYVFGDNDSVIKNSSQPESTLKKKHHSISYHTVREAVAMGIALIFKVDTGYNLADVLTKVLPPDQKRKLLSWITY